MTFDFIGFSASSSLRFESAISLSKIIDDNAHIGTVPTSSDCELHDLLRTTDRSFNDGA